MKKKIFIRIDILMCTHIPCVIILIAVYSVGKYWDWVCKGNRNRWDILNLLITRVVAAQFHYGTSVMALHTSFVGSAAKCRSSTLETSLVLSTPHLKRAWAIWTGRSSFLIARGEPWNYDQANLRKLQAHWGNFGCGGSPRNGHSQNS